MWHVVVQEHSVLHSHWPQACIGNIRPMNGGVEHHGSGDGHDCLNVAFGDSIVMVSSCPSKPYHLFKLGQFGLKCFGGEGRTVVSQK